MDKVKFSGDCDKNKSKKKIKGVPLAITFYPLLKDFGKIINKKQEPLFIIHGPRRSKSF